MDYHNYPNQDYIYGYTNHFGKFFALEQPIKMSEKIGETEKEFRNKYKNWFTRLLHFDFKKKDNIEYQIHNSNDLIEITDSRMIEIK